MHEDRTGVVLAGGRSERFGDPDKALVPVDGTPMVCHVVEALTAVASAVVLNCRRDQRAALESAVDDRSVTVAVDPVPDEGPVAGFGSALDAVDTAVVGLVACDMPAVDPDFLRYLFERLGGNDAVVPRLRSGDLQPAQAVYRTEPARDAAAASLATGDRSLHDVVERLQADVLSPPEVHRVTTWRSLTDVNTQADLADLETGSS